MGGFEGGVRRFPSTVIVGDVDLRPRSMSDSSVRTEEVYGGEMIPLTLRPFIP